VFFVKIGQGLNNFKAIKHGLSQFCENVLGPALKKQSWQIESITLAKPKIDGIKKMMSTRKNGMIADCK
jgi:hypothetical protein